MTAADSDKRAKDDAGQALSRTRRLKKNFSLLLAAFSLAIFLLAVLSVIAFYALSGARAYVNGESQWTKAQKQAVIALFSYAQTGEGDRLQDFNEALQVNHGDRQARLALSRENPDREAARRGFLQGKNQAQDVKLMIALFIVGRDWPLFSDAIEIWAAADQLIAVLEREAEVLRGRVERFGPGTPPVFEQLERIKAVDRELTRQEDLFSRAMGKLSHRLTSYLSMAVFLFALALTAGALLLAWYLLRINARRESVLAESEQRYRALVDQPEVGMWQVDPEGKIVFLNPAMRMLLGLERDEDVQGQQINDFIAESDQDRVDQNRLDRINGQGKALEVSLIPREGSPRTTLVHGAPIRIGEDIVGHVGTCVDISARKQAEHELRHMALHDMLTGLPNRKLFMDRLHMALKRARRANSNVAVLFIDLDRFKIVNDALGHSAGDRLLREAARRLEEQVRERDTLARFGGDEFGVVLEPQGGIEGAVAPADRIIAAFKREFEIDGVTAKIGASIGIAFWDGDESRPEDLVRNADIAMYAAKRDGGGSYHVYDPQLDEFHQVRLSFESDLWQAAERHQLRLLYQPIVDLDSSRVESLEALVRWEHPEQGLLTPDQFIPTAEETGAIVSIGQWVARRACRDFKEAKNRLGEMAPKAIAINMSDVEFRLGEPSAHLKTCCEEAGIPPKVIRIEVTESMLIERPEALEELRSLGHEIAIDDFGTGYASLDRLRNGSFGTLKIDRSFVSGFRDSPVDLSIIEALVHIGRKLDLRIVAEGIEHGNQISDLRNLGCKFGQGYFFAYPAPIEATIKTIQTDTKA